MESVKEIKKGLECCSTLMDNNTTSEQQDNSCNECPYRLNDRCSWNLDKDALTLINELESENDDYYERATILRRENEQLKTLVSSLENQITELKQHIIEVEKGIINIAKERNKKDELASKFIDSYNDSLKQFAERLKDEIGGMKQFFRSCIDRDYCGLTEDQVDKTLKEFIEK